MVIQRVLLTLNGAAGLRRDALRQQQIQDALRQHAATLQKQLRGLPAGTIVPVSMESPLLARHDGRLVTTGINPLLAQLGVQAIEVGAPAVAESPEIVYGPLSALDQLEAVRAGLRNGHPVKVLMHAMATYAIAGIPRSQIEALERSLGPNVQIKQLLSGATSFPGIDYTGNAGANYYLLEHAARKGYQIVILAGGFGTRLALLEKVKAFLEIGPQENLFTNNVVFGKYLLGSFPAAAQGDRVVMLACDGKFVPTGQPMVGVRTLKSIPPDQLKDVYCISSPLPRRFLQEKGFIPRAEVISVVPEADKYKALLFDGKLSDNSRWVLKPNIGALVDGITDLAPHKKAALKQLLAAREDPTFRFGIMVFDRYGNCLSSSLNLLTSGEKIGIVATVEKAKEKLRELGRSPDIEELSVYLNWYGFTATHQWIKELGQLLDVIIDPATGATLRTAGNLDTYGLLLTALSIFNDPALQDPQGRLRKLLLATTHQLMPETQIDINFLERLRNLLFDRQGNCRVGFINLGTDAITQDLGALSDILVAEQSLLEGMNPSSVLYDRFLKARELLERGRALTTEQITEIDAVMAEVRAAREIQREIALRECGFDAEAILKNVSIVAAEDESMLPILGASVDEHMSPAETSRIADEDGWGDPLARIARNRSSRDLPIYRDSFGRALFKYDPEGIKTLRLENVILTPGVVIGRHVGIRGEGHVIGHPDGTKTTYIADGGVIIGSSVRGSFIHPSSDSAREILRNKEIVPVFEQLSENGRGANYDLELPNGNVISITYEGTLQEQQVRSELNRILTDLQKEQGRQLLDQKRIEEVFGIVDGKTILTFDKQKMVRLFGPPDSNGGPENNLQKLLDGSALRQEDPSEVLIFRVALRKKPLPGYIVYRCDQDSATRQITAPTLHMAVPLLSSREVARVAVPLTFNPDKQPLSLAGRTVPVKSIQAQAAVALFKETKILSDQELVPLAEEIAKEVDESLAFLPTKARLGSLTPFAIDTARIENAITDAVRANPSSDQDIIADVIADELIEQTPALLKHYIAQITGFTEPTIDNAFLMADNFNDFCDKLGLTLTEGMEAARRDEIKRQRGAIKSLMEAFPPAELVDAFNGLNGEGMTCLRDAIIAILTRFRTQEVRLAPQPPSLVDVVQVNLSRSDPSLA